MTCWQIRSGSRMISSTWCRHHGSRQNTLTLPGRLWDEYDAELVTEPQDFVILKERKSGYDNLFLLFHRLYYHRPETTARKQKETLPQGQRILILNTVSGDGALMAKACAIS